MAAATPVVDFGANRGNAPAVITHF
jgi:hypothetical protein